MRFTWRHCVKSVQYAVFFWCVFSWIWTDYGLFSPNTGKYPPQKPPYWSTFHAVKTRQLFDQIVNLYIDVEGLMLSGNEFHMCSPCYTTFCFQTFQCFRNKYKDCLVCEMISRTINISSIKFWFRSLNVLKASKIIWESRWVWQETVRLDQFLITAAFSGASIIRMWCLFCYYGIYFLV